MPPKLTELLWTLRYKQCILHEPHLKRNGKTRRVCQLTSALHPSPGTLHIKAHRGMSPCGLQTSTYVLHLHRSLPHGIRVSLSVQQIGTTPSTPKAVPGSTKRAQPAYLPPPMARSVYSQAHTQAINGARHYKLDSHYMNINASESNYIITNFCVQSSVNKIH